MFSLALSVFLASGGCEHRLGRVPHLDVDETRAEFEPFVELLGRRVSCKIELVVPRSYDEVVDGLVQGQIDFAFLPALAYVRAKNQLPNLRLLVTLMGEGALKYRSYVVVRRESRFVELSELHGGDFAFVDPSSTSGFLLPMYLLEKANLASTLRTRFVGSHPAVVEAVLNAEVDAGAISSTTFQHLREEGLNQKLRILAKSDWIPFDAIVARPDVPPTTVQKVREVLLELSVKTAEGRSVLKGTITNNGFIEVQDAHYDPVRRILQRLEVSPKR